MSEEAEKTQSRTQAPPPLREVSDVELQGMLEAHQRWLESGEKEGTRADLSFANLQGRDLQRAQLSKANLRNVNLQNANLRRANLEDAFLHEAHLHEAFLAETNLRRTHLLDANMKRAHLLDADLQGATLWRVKLEGAALGGTNLQEADLTDADMEEAYLYEANLREAILTKINLRRANLTRTVFREADLQDADLTGANGLLAGQLAGANVAGAKLPPDIQKFEALKTVEEASKNTKRIFLAMLLGCAYSALTIFSTTDARLLTNFASSPLPIIQTPIPIAGFFCVAPAILLATYLYFHFYLQRLWEGLADLPAIFPDGRPLDKRAYPWLLNGLVRSHFVLLRGNRPPLSRLQAAVSILLAWWAVPFTIVLFWLHYLPRHHWLGTAGHIVLLVASMGFGIMSYRLARTTLRGEKQQPFTWARALKDSRTYKRVLIAVGIGTLFFLLSLGAIEGEGSTFDMPEDFLYRPPSPVSRLRVEFRPHMVGNEPPAREEEAKSMMWTWVPRVFGLIGYNTFADLREVEVSTKPANWRGQNKEDLDLVKGARLRGRNLRYANAYLAFLAKADLRGATLEGANLFEANLQGARLFGADLQSVRLMGANLRWADLRGANLRGARLHSANLREADLRKVDFQGAQMPFTDLRGANFFRANLQGVDLTRANLSAANLSRANLVETFLVGANLVNADLEESRLESANITNANLAGANLREVMGVIPSQVKTSRNWELAFYSDDFLKKLGLPSDHNERVKRKLANLEEKGERK